MLTSTLCRLLSVACVVLYAVLFQLCCAIDIHHEEAEQTTTHCLRSCSHLTRRLIERKLNAKQISKRQSCYEECLRKIGKHELLRGNQQTKPLFKRIKRDASSAQANSKQSNESNGLCRNYTGEEDNLRGLNKEYIKANFFNNTGRIYANISWNPPRETANWTGYRLIYGNKDWEMKCTDVKKNVKSITVFHDWKGLAYLQLIYLPQVKINNGQGYKPYYVIIRTATTGQPSTATSTHPREQANPPSSTVNTTLLVTTTAPVAVILTVVAAVVYWYFRRSSPEALVEGEWKFDAFIIYSSKDEEWVKRTLLPTLQTHRLKYFIHYRDFAVGKPFRDNMVDGVYKSRKTVAVVSRSFLNSTYCKYEMEIALHRLVKRRDDSVVVIKLDDVDRERLPEPLQERSYIDYPKSIKKKAWEKKLVDCLKVPIEQTSGNNQYEGGGGKGGASNNN